MERAAAPSARLLLCNCWRSIVFLIRWDLERKAAGLSLKGVLIIISYGLKHIEKEGNITHIPALFALAKAASASLVS